LAHRLSPVNRQGIARRHSFFFNYRIQLKRTVARVPQLERPVNLDASAYIGSIGELETPKAFEASKRVDTGFPQPYDACISYFLRCLDLNGKAPMRPLTLKESSSSMGNFGIRAFSQTALGAGALNYCHVPCR
jgi:hypothetical protein